MRPFHALAVVLCVAASAASQIAPIYTEVRKLGLDSGYIDNLTDRETVAFSKVLETQDVAWIRLYFSGCNLPEGSRIRLTSLADKAVQFHDSRSILDYG